MKDLVGWLQSKLTVKRLNIRQHLSSFLVKLVKILNAKKYEIYTGKLVKVKPDTFSKNLIVLTPDGIGKLGTKVRLKPVYDIKNNKVSVTLADSREYREFNSGSIFLLQVIDEDSYIGYPLHPEFYKYVAHAVGENIKYHLSKKRNALLPAKEVKRLEIIGVIGSTKGGLKVLNKLRKKGFLHLLNM